MAKSLETLTFSTFIFIFGSNDLAYLIISSFSFISFQGKRITIILECLKKLKALATEKLKPAAKALDLRSFSIVRKATSNVSFLKDNPISVAKWVLPNQGSIVLVKEYLGI